MAINYPNGIDTFNVPSDPENTSLSSAGTGSRDHTQLHQDIGDAMMALEANATPLHHDHSGTDGNGIWPTSKLLQVNTHQSPDTDTSATALHHTLGTSPLQAAAGNHAHDYTGPSIFNKPLMICTSTTRPVDPVPGMMIYETDTNTVRAWAQFANNTLQPGVQYTYGFNTNNNATQLDTNIFSVTYPVGSSPTDGAMGTPTVGDCAWHVGADANCRAIAQAVVVNYATTATDDQQLTFVTGTSSLEPRDIWQTNAQAPTNDAYLRMSADGSSYVRFSLDDEGCKIYWTKTGPAGEAFLGGAYATTTLNNATWMCKAIGSTYVMYVNGVQVLAVVDYENVINVGADYRGWGIGMSAVQTEWIAGSVQRTPNDIVSVSIADLAFYTTNMIWQLLPVGATPHIVGEAHFRQQVAVNSFTICAWDTILWDWIDPFTNVMVSQTDITVQESGHYSVHASICWDPSYNSFDHAMIGCTVNGQDIGRKNWTFMRGNGFAPGFSQTIEIYFSYYFAKGDVVRFQASHNGALPAWLDWILGSPDTQGCYFELNFTGP